MLNIGGKMSQETFLTAAEVAKRYRGGGVCGHASQLARDENWTVFRENR